jgi:hypothetical protein
MPLTISTPGQLAAKTACDLRNVTRSYEYEKTRLVMKLKQARDRKREQTGKKVEGRKSWAEMNIDVVLAARELRGMEVRPPSLRKIAAALAARGHRARNGNEFSPSVIKSLLRQAQQPNLEFAPDHPG